MILDSYIYQSSLIQPYIYWIGEDLIIFVMEDIYGVSQVVHTISLNSEVEMDIDGISEINKLLSAASSVEVVHIDGESEVVPLLESDSELFKTLTGNSRIA